MRFLSCCRRQQSLPLRCQLKDDKPSRTKEQKEYDKALDRAYQSSIKDIPEPKKKSDPWGDIRPSPPAAAKNKQQ
jgi:hypothetical protein